MSQKRGRTAILVDFFKDALGHAKYRNLYILDSSIVILELPDSRIFKNQKDRKPFEKILRDYAMRTIGRYRTGKDYDKVKQAIFCAIKKSSYLTICGPKERNKVKFCFKEKIKVKTKAQFVKEGQKSKSCVEKGIKRVASVRSRKKYIKIDSRNQSKKDSYSIKSKTKRARVSVGRNLKMVRRKCMAKKIRRSQVASNFSPGNDAVPSTSKQSLVKRSIKRKTKLTRVATRAQKKSLGQRKAKRVVPIRSRKRHFKRHVKKLVKGSKIVNTDGKKGKNKECQTLQLPTSSKTTQTSPIPTNEGAHGPEKLYLKSELTEGENESMETEDHGFEARPEEQLSVDSECKDRENGNCLTSNRSFDDESMETEDHGFEARPEERLSVDSECKDLVISVFISAHGSEKLYLKSELTEGENESMETEDHGFEARPEEQLSVDSECKDFELNEMVGNPWLNSYSRDPLPITGQQHDTSALLYFNEEMFETFRDHSDLRYQDLRTEPDFCNPWARI